MGSMKTMCQDNPLPDLCQASEAYPVTFWRPELQSESGLPVLFMLNLIYAILAMKMKMLQCSQTVFRFLINTNACISIVNQASESKAGDCTATLIAGAVYGSVGKAVRYLNLFFFLLVTQWKGEHSLPTEVVVRRGV